MKLIEKAWGQQVWLDNYRQDMRMNAGGKTSSHYHPNYDTEVLLLEGDAVVQDRDLTSRSLVVNRVRRLPAGSVHRIMTAAGCVIHEIYHPRTFDLPPLPIDDIVRVAP